MKLSKSKLALAKIINENGGWPSELATFAVQDEVSTRVFFTDGVDKPIRASNGGWQCKSGFAQSWLCKPLGKMLNNWHQCVLSREEYHNAYPKVDVDRCLS